MKKFTMQDIINGQEQAKISKYNTDLFAGDREPIESFDKSAFSEFHLVGTDHRHDIGEHDKLIETVVAIGHESDFYLITATTSSFNGELQVNFTQQEITLKGLNYFTKEADIDLEDVYNNFLVSKGYELTIEDVETLGELNTEFNVTTLKFKDESENMHYLTVNAKHQLSGVTVKISPIEVKPKQSKIKSAFE